MSATDRIRESVRSLRESGTEPRYGKHLSVDVDAAEALCDLADAARLFLHDDQQPGEATREPMRDALARLDGEDGP